MLTRRTIIALAAFSLMTASAQTTHNTSGQRLEGSWVVTVNRDPTPGAPPPTPIPALASYSRDGLLIFSSPTAPPPIPPIAGATPSAAHGEWVRIGDRQFAVTFILLYVNAGKFVASLKVRGIANLNDTLDTFTGPYQAEYRDANGNVFLTGTGNVQGSRIGVDVLPHDELK